MNGSKLLDKPISFRTNKRLQAAMEVSCRVDVSLPAKSVQVHFDEGPGGGIRNIRIHYGREATLKDVLRHDQTVLALQELQGVSGLVRRLVLGARARLEGTTRLTSGKREAWLELEKLPAFLKARVAQLKGGTLKADSHAAVQAQIQGIGEQITGFCKVFNLPGKVRARKFVAVEDPSAPMAKKGFWQKLKERHLWAVARNLESQSTPDPILTNKQKIFPRDWKRIIETKAEDFVVEGDYLVMYRGAKSKEAGIMTNFSRSNGKYEGLSLKPEAQKAFEEFLKRRPELWAQRGKKGADANALCKSMTREELEIMAYMHARWESSQVYSPLLSMATKMRSTYGYSGKGEGLTWIVKIHKSVVEDLLVKHHYDPVKLDEVLFKGTLEPARLAKLSQGSTTPLIKVEVVQVNQKSAAWVKENQATCKVWEKDGDLCYVTPDYFDR